MSLNPSGQGEGSSSGVCSLGAGRVAAWVVAGAVAVGVLLPAGMWFWSALAERWDRTRTASIHEEAGDQAFASGDYARAMMAYTYARDMDPRPEVALKFIRARVHLASVRPDLMARWDGEDLEYQRAFLVSQDPGSKAASEAIAGHLRRLAGDAEGAKERYKAALAADEACPGAHLGLGLLAHRAGKVEDAKTELETFVKAFPVHREALLALADIRINSGDADGAIELLNRLLAVGPDAEAHHGLGLAYQRKNQAREALAHFQTAVRLNPNARESHMALGNLYLEAELYALAEASFRTALNLSQDETALVGLARSLNGQKRFDETLQALAPLLQRGNAGPLALLTAADAAQGVGRKDDAARLYREVLSFLGKLEGRADPKAIQALKKEAQEGLDRLQAPAPSPAPPAPKP